MGLPELRTLHGIYRPKYLHLGERPSIPRDWEMSLCEHDRVVKVGCPRVSTYMNGEISLSYERNFIRSGGSLIVIFNSRLFGE